MTDDDKMLGTPEQGRRLAKHGFGLTDEEIAAAAAPDSAIRKEIEAAQKATPEKKGGTNG